MLAEICILACKNTRIMIRLRQIEYEGSYYMENIKIFACSEYAQDFTQEICEYLNIPMGKINTMKFKNDNNFVQILETVREHDVYLVQSNVPPVNERIMELLITIDAVKRASAGKINVVLPYYIYSRSDKKDQPRVPITAKLIAELLEAAAQSCNTSIF
jgi:ribose-phosphate pyrophosphokinase